MDAFFNPTIKQGAFLVKAVFVEGRQIEHNWIADLEISDMHFRGVIANEPVLPGLKFKQLIEFKPAQVSDWMYIDDGYLVGGFTTRVIRDRMSPEARKAHDAAAPYKFRDVS